MTAVAAGVAGFWAAYLIALDQELSWPASLAVAVTVQILVWAIVSNLVDEF